MRFSSALLMVTALTVVLSGCIDLTPQAPASKWKIHQGPSECIEMCKSWDLEFAGMVGVGNQEKTGDGATACVCQPKSGGNTEDREGRFRAPQRLQIVAAAQAAAQAAQIVIERRRAAAAASSAYFETSNDDFQHHMQGHDHHHGHW